MLIVYGPTGVGKTDFALKVAQHIKSEIINMDIGQFYTPLSIGTAKPNWRSQSVRHHFFDILDKPQNYTVVHYRNACLELVKNICKQGKLPILVGGSGFYLKSLFFPPYNQVLNDSSRFVPDNQSWHDLYAIDPARALKIEKNDSYRINRALTIWHNHGIKPSEYMPVNRIPGNFHVVFLSRPRQNLYDRINRRIITMLDNGWLEEVEPFLGTDWEQFIQEKKIIGYNELLDHLNNRVDLVRAISIIQKRTRRYAKRQYTFWRMLAKILAQNVMNQHKMSKIESIDLTLMDVDLYIKKLQRRFAHIIK